MVRDRRPALTRKRSRCSGFGPTGGYMDRGKTSSRAGIAVISKSKSRRRHVDELIVIDDHRGAGSSCGGSFCARRKRFDFTKRDGAIQPRAWFSCALLCCCWNRSGRRARNARRVRFDDALLCGRFELRLTHPSETRRAARSAPRERTQKQAANRKTQGRREQHLDESEAAIHQRCPPSALLSGEVSRIRAVFLQHWTMALRPRRHGDSRCPIALALVTNPAGFPSERPSSWPPRCPRNWSARAIPT